MTLIKRMKQEVRNHLDDYLDGSRCFNTTQLGEHFLNVDNLEEGSDEEDEYWDAAASVASWAIKEYNLNE